MKDNNALNERKKEISNLLISPQRNSLKYSVKNKIIANSVIKNIIKKIPANTNSSLNTPNEFNNLSESNNLNNISEINKKTLPNKINSFEFFNKISNGINIKKQISEKILKKIDSYPFSLKNKLNIINNKTSDFQNSAKAINSKNRQNKIQKIDNLSHSIKHTQLINPIKRSLTRNNTNKINMHHELIDLNKNFKNRIKNKLILNHQLNFEKKCESNKENNFNSLNKCHINNAILKTDTFIINSNNNIIKSELNNKNTRNKIHVNFNPFYYTNSNNTHNNNFIGKKPIRVLSSIRKIISQKLNNISGNSNSFFKNINISNSNSSLQGNNNHGKILNNKKFVYLSNHNSKNNTSEYITPRKSRLYYYYH